MSNSVCVASLPTGILPLRFGTLKVLEPSQTPYVVDIIANSAEYVALETAVPSQRRNHVGAELVDHILISHVIPRAFRVLELISSHEPRDISSTAHVPPHALPRSLSADIVRPLVVTAHGAT